MPFQHNFAWLFGQDTTIAEVVFGLVVGAMIVGLASSWWLRRHGRGPSQKAEANKIELSYLGVLAAVVVFLMVTGVTANDSDFPNGDPPPPAVKIDVTAFQWCWTFQYTGQPVTVTGRCTNDSYPTMVVPTGRRVELDVTSTDVIHAFWVPYLKVKMYAYPGHINKFTVTLDRSGRWIGRCAQLCGLYHYQMDFWIKAEPVAQYNQFLRAHGGTALTASRS